MPVTAKLSKAFYDKLGHQVADELVEWFNSVDATYRGDLRDLNELNFARFDAKVEQRMTTLEARLEQRIVALEAKFEQRMTVLEAKVEQRMAALEAKVEQRAAELRAEFRSALAGEVGRLRSDLIKWSFVFFVSAALAVLGLR